MAARSTDDLAEEELDAVAAVDDAPDDDFGLAEADLDELEDEPDDDLEPDIDDDLEPDIDEALEDDELEDGVEVDPDEAEELTLPTFDEDDEALVRAVVEEEDEDDPDADGLREGEFVCRSCYMAKRESALADPKRMLCRDCA